ncbi:MAG: gliding motility-associated C-terminal domain-containing protein [Crocinitomicaceae bacterium]|nr:gliding motility-associated C-terminal domain-containing protein [Crocinitomicaceae bacterium]
MKKLYTVLVALGIINWSYGQNIVPNPSLENYTACPTGVAQVNNLIGWQMITNHTGSADMLNACNTGIASVPNNAFGNQAAHTGVGYFGFAVYYQATPNFREYTYCTFTSPMVAGTTYDISFWVSLSDNSQFGTDDGLELYFSNVPVTGTGGNWAPITTITPQIQNTTVITDKVNWIQVSYQYTAVGGELYMTLGNFKTDVNTTTYAAGAGSYSTVYLYVDDFIVEPVVSTCNAGWTTTTACSADGPINLNTLITGDTGGTWSGTGVSGNTFNPASGTQSVTYTSPNGCDSTQTITITPSATATWTIPTGLCTSSGSIDLSTYITGTAGGTWSGTGITGNMFNTSVGTQSITYSVGTAPCDDAVTQTITVTPQADATWTNPGPLCSTGSAINLDTYVTGTAGGTWSGTGVTGNMFDPANGTQTVTYSVGTAPCNDALSLSINVVSNADASWTIPTGLCDSGSPIDLSTFVTGTTGGTFSGTGISGNMFDPSVGTQSITYTVGTAPCNDVVTQTITVGTQADATWSAPTGLCTASPQVDLSTLITGTTGGTFSGTGISGNMFDPSVGTQSITYTVGTAPCDDQLALTINVATLPSGAWTVPVGLCLGDSPIDLSTFITGASGGTWSGTGITGSMFDPSVGTQSITYTTGTAPCTDAVTQTITVAALYDPAWTIPANICESDAPFDLSTFITGDVGGTWSGTGVSGTNFDPSAGTQSITYTIGSGGCQDQLTQTITVTPASDPSWTTTMLCTSSTPINLDNLITGDTGGSWSGTGVTGNVFDPTNGTQTVTYSITSGACTATSTQSISVVDPQVSASGTAASCFGQSNGTASATVSGGSGNYTYSWNTTPAQTTSNASNLAAGSYTVTVTDVDGGCTVTADVTIIEPSQIQLVLTPTNVCAPLLGSASVTASGGVGGFTYNWSPVISTDSIATGIDSAMATVVVTDGNGCTATDSVFVTVYPQPVVTTSMDTTIYWGDFAMLSATGGVSYSWTPNDELSCDDCASPIASPDVATQYCVTVTDANGCVNEACTWVYIEIVCGEVFVPSAFSPNNDGENDILCVYTDCYEQLTFTIYNRWGEAVFESSSENICWDGTWKGKELNSAVFVYTLDGYLINGQTVSKKGNISLIR